MLVGFFYDKNLKNFHEDDSTLLKKNNSLV